jgi:hypothetical protein
MLHRFRVWRSATAGWIAAGVALVGGVPLFLCLPLWADVTLYDLAARAILRGGVAYRDVFDTNPPGMPVAHAAVRSVVGWSSEAIRAVDLLVVAATTALLAGWLRRAGATRPAVAWFVAGVAWFYPFTTEFSHCQRDVWLFLPAVLACRWRVRQRERPSARWAFAEGLVWGLAAWVKPFVLVPAAAVWLASVWGTGRRAAVRDFAALLAGGLVAGFAGVGWLVASGAWPYFWDVFANWNPEYAAGTLRGVGGRVPETIGYFPPWSLVVVVALPVAARSLVSREATPSAGAATHSRDFPRQDAPALGCASRLTGRVLVAFFLGWFAQALVLQRGFDYVHVPETVLALAVLATRGWTPAVPVLAWFALTGVLFAVVDVRPLVVGDARPYFYPHPLADPKVVPHWPRCFVEGSSPELRDQLAAHAKVHCGTEWVQLDNVATFLRTVDPPLRAGELTCWHDSTHPLYLMLDAEPSTRYLHFGTVFGMRTHAAEVAAAVAASRQRYVVSDLRRVTWNEDAPTAPGEHGPHSLPAWFPASQRDRFPWNQPVVFRSGRYVVHRVAHPLGPIDVPAWEALEGFGPPPNPR